MNALITRPIDYQSCSQLVELSPDCSLTSLVKNTNQLFFKASEAATSVHLKRCTWCMNIKEKESKTESIFHIFCSEFVSTWNKTCHFTTVVIDVINDTVLFKYCWTRMIIISFFNCLRANHKELTLEKGLHSFHQTIFVSRTIIYTMLD